MSNYYNISYIKASIILPMYYVSRIAAREASVSISSFSDSCTFSGASCIVIKEQYLHRHHIQAE